MTNLYCLDTSVLIESWWRIYRPSSFPSFWTRIGDAINQGCLISPSIVLDELKRKEDDQLYKWSLNYKSMFHPLNQELQQVQASIINRFPKLVNQNKNRSMCDPWVIALAQIMRCPVVTEEDHGSKNKPRIPDVCDQLGIGCIKVADLIEGFEWTF